MVIRIWSENNQIFLDRDGMLTNYDKSFNFSVEKNVVDEIYFSFLNQTLVNFEIFSNWFREDGVTPAGANVDDAITYITGQIAQDGNIDDLEQRLEDLETTVYEVEYSSEINSDSGTITIPSGATIALDQFPSGVDALVSTIANGQPTGDLPQTSGGNPVDVLSFDTGGNYTLTGTPDSFPAALIYILRISIADFGNLNLDRVLNWSVINQSSAGNNTEIQFNNNNAFGASADLTWDGSTFNANGNAVFENAEFTNQIANGDRTAYIGQNTSDRNRVEFFAQSGSSQGAAIRGIQDLSANRYFTIFTKDSNSFIGHASNFNTSNYGLKMSSSLVEFQKQFQQNNGAQIVISDIF